MSTTTPRTRPAGATSARSLKSRGRKKHISISILQGYPYLLVAEWTHFTLFGIILPTIKLKVYTFWGL